ncbi:MAG: hypothetical protein K2Q22_08795, partial [Cytophagales bacterium]|nr:hypothetical protein [Cytophagales bacterium]
VFFSSPPTQLTYNLKGNGFTSPGPFEVLESANGTVWTAVRSFSSLSGTCTAYADPLNVASRYVRFVYSNKSSGNVQLDNVSITSGIVIVPNPTNLSISNPCISSLTLGWTLPSGYAAANSTILVFAKVNSAISIGSATSPLVTYTADADFSGVGTAYQNDPLTKCVYKGDGTSVNITGLLANTTYHFLVFQVVDVSSLYSNGTPFSTSTTGISPVSNVDATTGNGQIAVTWLNPTTCFDEVLVLGKSGSITEIPSGNGIGTIASSNFGSGSTIGLSSVVYKGTGTTVTVNNLTNGTTYCFKIFTRKGSTWSTGIQICTTPTTSSGTILNPGDMAIVGYDAQYLGSGNPDLIAFVNLVPLNPGTSFLLTDNGFEVVAG